MRENSEMKARLERLEALLSAQVPGIFSTNSQAETLSNTPTSQDMLARELEKTQDLMAESETLAKNLDIITKMAVEESQKLDQLHKADADEQAKLEAELRQKQDLVKQREKDLEDIKVNRSNRSVSNSISKTHFQNSKQTERHRNRENSKVSHAYSHNSWMESDEDSVASSQNKSSSRRYQSSYGQQKFVTTAAFVSEAAQSEATQGLVAGEKKRESPSRGPKREHFQPEPILETLVENQTQATDPTDQPEHMDLISPMKTGTNILGINDRSHHKDRRSGETNDQLDQKFKKTQDKHPANKHKKPDGKTKEEKPSTRPAYSDRYNNIKSYEDYYKKYKSHIKRGFELLEEEEYVLKGTLPQTAQKPVEPHKKSNKSMFRTQTEKQSYQTRREDAETDGQEHEQKKRNNKKDQTRSSRPEGAVKVDKADLNTATQPPEHERTTTTVKESSARTHVAVEAERGSQPKRENSAFVSTQPTIIEEDAQECATAAEVQSIATITSNQKKPTRRGGKAARLKRQRLMEKYGKLTRDPNDSSQLMQSQASMTLGGAEEDSCEAPSEKKPQQPPKVDNKKPPVQQPKSALLPDLDLIEASDHGESSEEWFQVTGGKDQKPTTEEPNKAAPAEKGSKPAKNPNKVNNQPKPGKPVEVSSGTGGRLEKGDKGDANYTSTGSSAQDKKHPKGPPKPEPSDQRKKKK